MQKHRDMIRPMGCQGLPWWRGFHSPLSALEYPRSGVLVPTQSSSILSEYPQQAPFRAGDSPTIPPYWGRWSRVPIRVRHQKFC